MEKRIGQLRATFLILAAVALAPGVSIGQPLETTWGVVWSPPATFSEMRHELQTMSEYGVKAARVNLVSERNTHVLADLFGIRLYQDIDLSFAPAEVAAGRIEALSAQIDSSLMVATTVSDEQFIGLGYWNDTSDDRMCATLQKLADVAKRKDASVKTYYITPFIESDRCSSVVDFVLLDSRDEEHPRELLERWRRVHDTPVGIAAIGAPVYPGTESGYRIPESPEAQARVIESALDGLVNDSKLAAVFVDRWVERGPRGVWAAEIGGDFGILAPDGSPRPAASVVKGFFTGKQRVFAFSAGDPATEDYSWLNLIAFITATLVGLTYYSSLGFRSVLRRYFLSHSFYLEKVSDGREASMGNSLFLLACLSFAASIVGTTLVMLINSTNVWYALLAWLPGPISRGLGMGARYPGILVVTFAGLFTLVTLLWAVGLSAITRGTKRLGFDQTLLLAVMPRWPVALIGVLVLVVLNWQLGVPIIISTIVAAAWLVVLVGFTGRMMSDYLRLLGITALLTIPVLILALALLLATGWLIVVTQDLMPELTFLWHLATRT